MKKGINAVLGIAIVLVIISIGFNYYAGTQAVSTARFDEVTKNMQDSINIILTNQDSIFVKLENIRNNNVITIANQDSIKTGQQILFEETQKLTQTTVSFVEKLKSKVRHNKEIYNGLKKLRNIF